MAPGGKGEERVGPEGEITRCDVCPGGGTGEQLQNSRQGLLSALPKIHWVSLGKSPNFSGAQLPHVCKQGSF